MISYTFKFICFRSGKVASSTIRDVLKPYSDKEIHIRLNLVDVVKNLYKHGLSDEQWSSYFKFSFVRNPYERVVSRYIYGSKKDYRNIFFCEACNDSKENFLTFVKNYKDYGREKILQFDKLCDGGGWGVPLNFIGKVECLQEDFNKIFDILNIEKCIIPHENKTERKDYRYYYTQEIYDLVTEKFKKDIEYFNYSF